MMAESLILLLVDPNDNVRQFGKCILEHVSNTRGLACGLKFLCSKDSSSAIFLGLRHALKVVQLYSVISKFHTLQHIFFMLCKLIKDDTSKPGFPETLSDNSTFNKYSSQGGFLTQSVVGSSPVNVDGYSLNVELKSQENFQYLLSKTAWPSIQKCLVEGKAFLDHSPCQMTCVRILEILPVVFKRLLPTFIEHSDYSGKKEKTVFDLIWLHDLIDWGKSSLKVVIVYWKRAVTSLMNLLKEYCSDASAPILRAIESFASCGKLFI
uniref:Helicase SEN1 isoform X4 n=1 Tax=Rhizophora mucronata TaxID=61149 RepID=A0A2P2M1D2_RHIMU